jgi:uncharacterized protein (UPF0332 family)
MNNKPHAIHNEKACDYLLSSGQFNDWVVTTAFYSALHYVCSDLFPLEQNGDTFNSFELYYRSNFKSAGSNITKHDALISLVNLHLPLCKRYYKHLFERCMTARYTNYKVTYNEAASARNDLERIKRQLSKVQVL